MQYIDCLDCKNKPYHVYYGISYCKQHEPTEKESKQKALEFFK